MAEAEAEAPRSRFWMEHPAVGVVQRVDAELGWALRKARWPIKEGIALLYEIAWNGAGYVVGYANSTALGSYNSTSTSATTDPETEVPGAGSAEL